VSFEVFPLSFAEFLRFRGLEHVPYSRVSESRMVSALEEYLKTGGLPEVVLADESMRPRILKEYVDWCSTGTWSSVTAWATRN